MTVAELGDRMSSRELSEWMAYYEIEPFGEERADIRQALTTSAVHNLHQAQTKNPQWTKFEDFMLYRNRPTTQPHTVAPDDGMSEADLLLMKFDALTAGKAG